MAYTCPTCSGTGLVSGSECPTCLGNRSLVESSQGLRVTWRGATLGYLTGVKYAGSSVSLEDVTGLTSPTRQYSAEGGQGHTGMIRQLIAGDVTPGTLDISWIGAGALSEALVGSSATLVIAQTLAGSTSSRQWNAMLVKQTADWTAGDLLKGTASFQLLGA
jgi:hypothetical protein